MIMTIFHSLSLSLSGSIPLSLSPCLPPSLPGPSLFPSLSPSFRPSPSLPHALHPSILLHAAAGSLARRSESLRVALPASRSLAALRVALLLSATAGPNASVRSIAERAVFQRVRLCQIYIYFDFCFLKRMALVRPVSKH